MKFSRYILLIGIMLSFNLANATDGKYIYKIDLTNVVDDKVFVELTVPTLEGNVLTFRLPKMIPGTYSIEDYGRFVSEFKAMDKDPSLIQNDKSFQNFKKYLDELPCKLQQAALDLLQDSYQSNKSN